MENSEKFRITTAIDAIIAACKKELGLLKADEEYWSTDECHKAENQIFEAVKNNVFDHEADEEFSSYILKATPEEALDEVVRKLEEIKSNLK